MLFSRLTLLRACLLNVDVLHPSCLRCRVNRRAAPPPFRHHLSLVRLPHFTLTALYVPADTSPLTVPNCIKCIFCLWRTPGTVRYVQQRFSLSESKQTQYDLVHSRVSGVCESSRLFSLSILQHIKCTHFSKYPLFVVIHVSKNHEEIARYMLTAAV